MATEVLLTPGPTSIPPQVFAAMSQPSMHHRSEVFKILFRKAIDNLRDLLQVNSDPIYLAGSGTAAMEASLLNLASAGDKVTVINAGKFGERWALIAKQLGLEPIELKVKFGAAATGTELKDLLRQHSDTKLVCMQQCETSTGTEHPVSELCSAVKAFNPAIITVVDAVSSIATTPLVPISDQIDVVAGAVHKGLMTPPGLSFLWLSDAAWRLSQGIKVRSLYFNLAIERKAHAKNTSAWTPAMNHILGLNAAFELIRNEGINNVFERHKKLSRACIAAVKDLGFELFSERPAAGVTAFAMPAGLDAESVRGHMLKQSAVRVAGGQDELKGRIIRIGHMGHTFLPDLKRAITALHAALEANKINTSLQRALGALESGYSS